MEGTEEKRQKLAEMMDKLAGEDIMVAFSGGVDSSLLLKAACDSAGRTGKKYMRLPYRPPFTQRRILRWQDVWQRKWGPSM